MSSHSVATWSQWGERLAPLLDESFKGKVSLGEDDEGNPILSDGILRLSLLPDQWLANYTGDASEHLRQALEIVIQGHAPDYWRESSDAMVQALGWLDRRIGRRSFAKWHAEHGQARNALEQQLISLRMRAEGWATLEDPHLEEAQH